MKKTLWVLSLAVLAGLLAVPTFSQCSNNLTYAGGATAGTYWTGYTNDPATGGIGGMALVIGASGTNSGIYPMTSSACSGYASCQSRIISGNYRSAGQTAQGTNAWLACPDTATQYITQIMWERDTEGVATHGAKFCAATAKYVSGVARWDFSQTMTPQNNKVFQTVPQPLVNASSHAGNSWTFTLRVPVPTEFPTQTNNAFRRQYYDSTITAPIVVAGWKLYYHIGTAPTSGDVTTGGWTPFTTTITLADDGLAYSQAVMEAITWNAAASSIFFACTPIFGAAEQITPYNSYAFASNYFVGQNSVQVGPTGAGVFGPLSLSATGHTINVNWTSGVETGVTAYQVYSADTSAGPFKASGNPIAPLGDGHSYTSSFNMPATKASGTVYVKVKATKSDSSEVWSEMKKVLYGFGTAPSPGVPK